MITKLCSKIAVVVTLLLTMGARAGQEQWTTDYDKAVAKAKDEKKILFLNFTSTDGNATVRKFNKEILGQDKFYAYAKDNGVILVDIIMGAKKSQNPTIKKQHQQAVKKYNVKKFPVVLIADPDGKVLGEIGYVAGGPEPFIAKLDEIIKKAGTK
jgi:protein disulfide-isomerase